jgi:hypothetical protein
MAKRLSDIEKNINESVDSFIDYLRLNFNSKVIDLIGEISEVANPYIFSGVIRNYFLKKTNNRDLDLFVDRFFDIEPMLNRYEYELNSFGGYKVNIDGTKVDLWFLKDTWAISKSQLSIDFELLKYIPHTAFFNFSSVIFSINEKKFFYTKHFVRFLRDKKIDIVYEPNPNEALCIVNTFYYHDILKLKLGNKLKTHIKKIANSKLKDTLNVQVKHFGNVLYSVEELNEKIKVM